MFRRSLIVWKLSAVFITIILLVFVILAYANSVVDEHYALNSARELCRFNSSTIKESIVKPLMTRDNESIKEMLDDLAKTNPVYREMRLVSHSGEVAVASQDSEGMVLPEESRSCQVCHAWENPAERLAVANHDEIVELSDGTRIVAVVTPLLNEPTCSTADCHVHADAGPVLGFLETEYSLSRVDAVTSARNMQTAVVVLIAIVLGTLGTWFMVGRFLERPMKNLITGMKRIAGGDLDFRMNVQRGDEFATVAESFNEMTSKLELLLFRLRETKNYMEGIVENSADIIITANPAGIIETFNAGAENVLGYQREEVIGQHVEKLFADPQERDRAIEQLADTDNVVNYEAQFVTKSGEVRDVILTLSRLRGPYDFPIGTLGISKDITTEKKLQRQLIQSERFAAIGQSIIAIQHAMKNMLNALTGGSYMVNKGVEKGDWKLLSEGWSMVEEGISNIHEVSRNLLKYVKDWEPEFERVDVGEMIKKMESTLTQTASGKGISFSTVIAPGLPKAYCDSSLVHSAIMDLISNALEACLSKEYEEGESPEIELTAGFVKASEAVAIEVRDNGPGMAEDLKAKIFTPFFSTKKKKGTGLGLALTSKIVSLHGGTIEVVSEPGKGAAFRILLPLAGPDKNKEDSHGEESPGH